MASIQRLLGLLALAVWLVACGDLAPEADLTPQKRNQMTDCQALYAEAPSSPQVASNLRYGELGTLILSFIDDATQARAVDWMGVNLGVSLGDGFGTFENLPMLALRTVVTRELITTLTNNLDGLLSIYPDEPLEYFLNTSVGFIGADAAREAFGLSGAGVGVAVIDSGIDVTHPDLVLGENVGRNVKIVGSILNEPVGGYLYADLANTDLTSGHGTHVAGTIGGLGRASNGRYTGVAPGATMIGVGAGDALFILYALQGFDFVMKPEIRETFNVRIISNSWGTRGRFAPYHPISLATKRAYDAGMMVVFAAGNSGPEQDTLNPYSASPCAISVAAGDKSGFLANFSSRGIPGDPYHKPDITAPGVQIIAARALTGAVTPPFTGDLEYGAFYSRISGTSMATPHVSGTLALMLEANPALSFEKALEMIQKTARPMFYQTDGFTIKQREDWEVGAGYLDAYEAVRLAVRSNKNRFELTTETLASWQGDVGTSVCLPLVGCAIENEHRYTLSVPSGLSALRIGIDWGNPALDLDLYVYDPNGNLVASSATLNMPEAVAIPNPQAGSWTVVVEGYLNTPVTYDGFAEGDKLVRRR
jgi:serine protease AprX